ncbi:unnamed protein product [Cylindrotheca closterium]|uniref:F-box domain-containing protein n=1 Tax=Cylindrotheca closterium TaxID=2856 RepID=A0AAD2CPP9_9STRA|nr:unnamed protein product [Cylindrotheca closterium]
MVKVNESWETRAFEAAERRRVTKERKEEKSRKRSHKLNAQNLLTRLDEIGERLLTKSLDKAKPLDIHIWTDSLPSDYVIADEYTDDMTMTPTKKGRARSNSYATSSPSTPISAKQNRRNRSNSYTAPHSSPQKGSKKNKTGQDYVLGRKGGRQRSMSNVSDRSEEEQIPTMCSQHFFAGKDTSGGKKLKKKGSNLSATSVSKQNISLFQVLTSSKLSEEKCTLGRDALEACKAASKANFASEILTLTDQMPAIYYLTMKLGKTTENPPKVSEEISSLLSKQDCPIASIVYLVIDGMLLFDRYRDGIVLTNSGEHLLYKDCNGVGFKRRTVSIGGYADTTQGPNEDILDHHQNMVRYLPSQILEYIVLFLPDESVSSMPLVCKSWYDEIGKSSPDLWIQLLRRRQWPRNDLALSLEPSEERDFYRRTFRSHFSAARNLDTIVQGLEAIEAGCRSSAPSKPMAKDVAILREKDSHGHYKPGETILRVFSEACVLVADKTDCTLSLYDVAETNGSADRRCRRKLSVFVAPLGHSKKNKCLLNSMDLDDETIGCLFSVGGSENRKTMLGVVNRQSFQSAAGRGGGTSQLEEGSLQSFDLQEKIIDCLVSCDDEEVTGWIYSNLLGEDGLDLSPIECDIKENIVACGSSQFLFEAAIMVPMTFGDDHDDPDLISTALLRLFLFDAKRGGVVWVGPSGIGGTATMQFWYPLKNSIARNSSPQLDSEHSHPYSETVFVSRVSADLSSILVSEEGDVVCMKVGKNTTSDSFSDDGGMWHRSPEHNRVVIATSSDIVVAECYSHVARDTTRLSHKSVFTFYPTADSEHNQIQQLSVEGSCFEFPIETLRGNHIIAFTTSDASPGADCDKMLTALLINVQSRAMIYRIQIEDSFEFIESSSEFALTCHQHTVAVATNNGLVLAGQDVRAFTNAASSKRRRPEKKKKKAGYGKQKKDVFARGMRQTLG